MPYKVSLSLEARAQQLGRAALREVELLVRHVGLLRVLRVFVPFARKQLLDANTFVVGLVRVEALH